MTRVLVLAWLLALACGGGAAKRSHEPAATTPRYTTRTIVDDSADEDDDSDGVQVISSRGRIDVHVVEKKLEPHKAGLTECFTSRVGRRRWLGGHVVLRWEVARSGEVTAVTLAESDLGAWPVEKCLLEVARLVSYGKPRGNGDAEVTIPLDFTATGRVETWVEHEAMRAVGPKQLAKLDACAKVKNAKVPRGEVVLTAYVGRQGKAQSVGFASPASELDELWADCAEQAVLAWQLPDPKGGIAKLALRYKAATP